MSHVSSRESIDVPLHRQIADALTQQVTGGHFKPGQRLPSERSIADEYHASRATVRTALQHLEQAGLITRRERRSAVVAFRRTVSPSVRIACGSLRLLQLFRRLGELQKLPVRYQLHYVDLQQGDAVGQVVLQPAESCDLLICDLHELSGFTRHKNCYTPLARSEFSDSKILPVLQRLFSENHDYKAIALGVWPEVVYTNRHLLGTAPDGPSEFGCWGWGQLERAFDRLSLSSSDYGFQFRPTFEHLSALMESRGASLYDGNGRIHRPDDAVFQEMLRFVYFALHENKTTPLLAKADQINLFADRRCGLALDGMNMYSTYRKQLGEHLGVTKLPRPVEAEAELLYGFGAVVIPGGDHSQPAIDLIRSLLSAGSQIVLHQLCGSLPVRSDLLTVESLCELGLEQEVAQFSLEQLSLCRLPSSPKQDSHKQAVESLFLELWLGLDSLKSLSRRFEQL